MDSQAEKAADRQKTNDFALRHPALVSSVCRVSDDIRWERYRQERCREEGRFRNTCFSAGLGDDADRYIVLSREVGEALFERALIIAMGKLAQASHLPGNDVRPALLARQGPAKLREELVQVAAVAQAWIEFIDVTEAAKASQQAFEG